MPAIPTQKLLVSTPAGLQGGHHRRNPSAPSAVTVLPTRTPGLLAISKPANNAPKASPHRQLPSNQRHVKQPSKNFSKNSQVVRAPAPPLTPPADNEKKHGPSGPALQQPRGRTAKQTAAAKDKAAKRSASQSSVRGKHGRQPSPPVSQQSLVCSSQAEVPVKSTNPFDPFLDTAFSSTPAMSNPPVLASRPSGKLARRRQQHQATTTATLTPPPTPSPVLAKAIPVPRPRTNNRHTRASNGLSRSDPVPSHMPNRPVRILKRANTTDVFPVCDDLTDASDDSDSEDLMMPTTPTRNGSRTAPINARASGGFPFNVHHSPSPVPMQQRATIGVAAGRAFHKRVTSDSLFSMSSDEDSGISTVTGSKLSPGVQQLFGLLPSTPARNSSTPPPAEFSYPSPFSTPIPARAVAATYPRHGPAAKMTVAEREAEFEREAEKEVKGYFASSLFQNSPSPEELPDPIFV